MIRLVPVDPTGRLGDDLALALRLADEASALALGFFRCGARARSKADGTVVTDGDIAVEQFLSAGLGTARPGDAILGEELGATGSAPRRWVLDPIDGTQNFVAGRADWGVHIALESEGEILLGVVTRPVLGQWWWASRAGGAYRGDLGSVAAAVQLRVSDRANLDEARVSGWLFDHDHNGGLLRGLSSWIEPVDLDTIMRVAEGELDVLVDGTASQIWDRAPLVVLVEEAGGRYRDRHGGRNLEVQGGIFTNGLLDADLDQLLAD